ncbi:MAG: hypothetical protein ACI88C_000089 [Acidimicrobiales bacterium]
MKATIQIELDQAVLMELAYIADITNSTASKVAGDLVAGKLTRQQPPPVIVPKTIDDNTPQARRAKILLEAIIIVGEGTARELANITDLTESTVHNSLSLLRELKLAHRARPEDIPGKGRKSWIWKATA